MPSPTYARQKLWQAVNTLATGHDPLQGRLANAAVYLAHLRPMHNEIAPTHREKLEVVMNSLTSAAPAGEEGAIAATIWKMTDAEAKRIADSIWNLFSELCVDLS